MMRNDIVYADMVKTLAKDGNLIVSELTPVNAHILHMAVGVAGETGELLSAIGDVYLFDLTLDLTNVKEEVGDIEFYLEGLCQGLCIPRHSESVEVIFQGKQCLVGYGIRTSVKGSDLLDAIKKGVIYNKPFDMDAIRFLVAEIDACLTEVRKQTGFTREEVLQANIDKLSVRYDGLKYSDASAQNRADKN